MYQYPFGPLVGSADRGALQRINSTYRELGEIGGYHRYKARLPPLSRGTVVSLMKAKKKLQPTNIYISSEKKREILNAASPRQTTQEKEQQSTQKYFFLTAAITPVESFPCHIAPTFSFPLLNLKRGRLRYIKTSAYRHPFHT